MNTETTTSAKELGVIRSLARVTPFAGADMNRLVLGMAIALVSSGFALGIPLVLERIVDGPLASGNPADIWWAVGLVALLGLLEAAFVFLRRITVLTPGTRIDSRMRNAIYNHLQNLPISFHDEWQSGQLLSRANTDVSLIRRWMSFGFVLLVANVITIFMGATILFLWSPVLAAVFLVCSVPMFVFGSRFRSRYASFSRAAQDQWGDVATTVEESVHGIRVLRSFGRGRDALTQFANQANTGRQTLNHAENQHPPILYNLCVPSETSHGDRRKSVVRVPIPSGINVDPSEQRHYCHISLRLYHSHKSAQFEAQHRF